MVYHQFAQVYDDLMKDAPYDDWISFTEGIFFKRGLTPSRIVDLGCGTGEITIRLSEKGYKMIGIDNSDDMLSIAQGKAQSSNQHIEWINQDIRNLTGFKDMEVFISYCDVMNYITTKSDAAQVFQRVYDCLSNNGIFIFDVHELTYIKDDLIGHTFAEITDDLTYIWECEGEKDAGSMTHYLTFFKRVQTNYARFCEEHEQKVFPLDDYVSLLKSIGFSKITLYSDFNLENEILPKKRERNFIIAEK